MIGVDGYGGIVSGIGLVVLGILGFGCGCGGICWNFEL